MSVVGQAAFQLLGRHSTNVKPALVHQIQNLAVRHKGVGSLLAHNDHICIRKAVAAHLLLPFAQIAQSIGSRLAPLLRAFQIDLVGEAKVDDFIHALALHLQLTGGKHLGCHPLFAAGGHVVQLVVFLSQLFRCAVSRGAAGVDILTGQALHEQVCGGDGCRVDKGRGIGFGFVALVLHDLAADHRMDESGHLAVALDDINVNALGGERLYVGEEPITQEGANRGCCAHSLGQIPRLINVDLVCHTCVSSYHFRKMPRLRRGTSTSSTLTLLGSTRPSAKNSPVR